MADVPTDSVPDSPGRPPPDLPLLRFRLRHLFWIVTVVAILLAAIVASSPGITPLVLVLAALVVIFHVAGTALGTRLRAHADEQRKWQAARELPVIDDSAGNRALSAQPPKPPWYGRRSSLRWLPWMVVVGTLVGSGGGAVLLAATIGRRSSPLGVAVGALSLGIIGGWFALLGGSFWGMVRGGWREAVEAEKQDESRRHTGH